MVVAVCEERERFRSERVTKVSTMATTRSLRASMATARERWKEGGADGAGEGRRAQCVRMGRVGSCENLGAQSRFA